MNDLQFFSMIAGVLLLSYSASNLICRSVWKRTWRHRDERDIDGEIAIHTAVIGVVALCLAFA